MSQTGYSKVQIYSSSTTTNTPSASNLTNDTNGSELAINITDGKLFYKDNGGTVQVIASKASNSGSFSSVAITGGSINGTTIGSSTASTGAFTTLSASSTVSGTGFSTYLASPPAIGGTTAAAGSFTTLSGSTSTTTPIVQSSGSLLLKTNGTTTAVTIDTSQRVGIGTASPSAPLEISTGGGTKFRVTSTIDNNADIDFYTNGVYRGIIEGNSVGMLFGTIGALPNIFITNNTERMRIDSSGNLGLGVTPSAWVSTSTAFQMKYGGSVWNNSDSTFHVSENAYFDGSNWKYIATGSATNYFQSAGSHNWRYAASGSAGGTISYTQAMTLDASGQLAIGQSIVSNSVNGLYFASAGGGNANIVHASGTASGTGYAFFLYAGSTIGTITQAGTTGVLYNVTSDRRLKTNIVDFTDSGKYIDGFKPRKFNWITDNSEDIGFITDEYQQTLPSAITGEANATKEEEYEVTPAVKDEQGNITTPAVMGTRTVPVYQQGDFSTSAKMAIIIAELQSLRARLKAANIA